MPDRELVARVDGSGPDSAASILIYRLGAQFEFVITEQKGGDASVFLEVEEALKISNSLAAALGK